MTIQKFISTSRLLGLAKANRFSVYFNAPRTLNSSRFTANTIRNIAMYCNHAELPAVSLSLTPIRTTGEVRNVAYDRNFDPFTLSFYCDVGMTAKYFFEEWINTVQNRDDRTFAYYDDYTTPVMVVDVETLSNTPAYRMEFYNVFPRAVSSINLDASNNGLMEISVTFEYRYWKSYQIIEGLTQPNYFTNDPFINIQGGLSLALGSNGRIDLNGGVNLIANSPLGSLTRSVQASFGTLSSAIAGLSLTVPSGYMTTDIQASITSLSGQAASYAGTTANLAIQLGTPSGINIAPATMAQISGQLQTVNANMSPQSAIGASVQNFTPSSSAAITSQLSIMGTQLNAVGVQLGVASTLVNTGILTASTGISGVALNAPRA